MTTFVFSFSLGVYLFNNFGISEGFCATRIPAASKDSIFSFAEPELPEMIAPACPICFPGGADCPAINEIGRTRLNSSHTTVSRMPSSA